MTREIAISATPEETRVVVLDDRKPVEIQIERSDDRSHLGSVFVGRVDRVIPGMQSAFVDIGLERHAFLHVSDVLPDEEDSDDLPGAVRSDRAERAAARADARIERLLSDGQRMLVQVTREPFASKGARVTTHVTFPGKFIVFMPTSTHVGISKRIEGEEAREGVRRVIASLGHLRGGLIVRTDAAGQSAEILGAELSRLHARWDALAAAAALVEPPSCLHREPGLAVRVVRDALAAELDRIIVDDDDTERHIREFLEENSPELVPRLVRHARGADLFADLGLDGEIDKALRSRVWLKSGGTLVIEQMEALVAIDVNSGKFTGGKKLE